MDIKALKEWVLTNNLEDRAIKGFWNTFRNYKEENFDAFEKDFKNYESKHISLFVDTVSLTITNWPDEDYNHVVISVRFQYKGKASGIYKMVFKLTGEVEDDYLTIY
ncbi:hypothetical protein [Brevibacillus laterosporus]|uniref:Uncharacterized protein n=1 Tax=Brevibacillus laterosporus TaxID=1465 RepID=A0AAP3GDJ8_BRELA|nr:hypothetical protein [Brevibacillus laterosporus]MCR8980879.1 hypothetical protein [Brevibacillus laterosporus]MCZ0808034.1 hypothetical protein [Brevibacillus laterosporus]MCZ0826404.1 hypothetical protein [Brevibacillus laterosporus]MCZ0852462.1 hypothetical protein [Brevibacillus laterosporus]NKQ22348.1 hypothetical protein [Brevibacillus laterosporus]